jgi:CRP-like cAMP-binding protein
MPKAPKSLFDPKLFLARVGEGKTILKFDKDQVVFSQGDAAGAVFYIQKGRIKVLVVSEQGKEAVVGILEAGQFFGEGCLNGHPIRISTTMAMEESLITSITKGAMRTALKGEPKFSELFMAYLLSPEQPHRRRSRRSAIQFEREAARAPSPASGKFRKGWHPAAHRGQCQSGDPGGNDWHHPLTRQLLHEQVSQARLHHL